MHLWLLANAQAEPGVWAVLRSIGAIALALSISVFAFIVPSGIGVREAILVAALAPYLGGNTGVALGITYASRMIFTAADVIAAGAAALSARRELRAVKAAGPAGDVADVPVNGRAAPPSGYEPPGAPGTRRSTCRSGRDTAKGLARTGQPFFIGNRVSGPSPWSAG